VEIGTGTYPGNAYCDPAQLLASDAKSGLPAAIERRGPGDQRPQLSRAIRCTRRPPSPRRTTRPSNRRWRRAEARGETVITSDGAWRATPGHASRTGSWRRGRPEFAEACGGSGRERVVPYGRTPHGCAAKAGVRVADRDAPQLRRLQPGHHAAAARRCAKVIGCNFDPATCSGQGSIRVSPSARWATAIFHVHARTASSTRRTSASMGVLDAKEVHRAERGTRVDLQGGGLRNGASTWKAMVSALRTVGYDHVISIEHEDRPDVGRSRAAGRPCRS